MSRWLQSVNHMLERLDDRAGDATAGAAQGVGAVRDLTQRFLSPAGGGGGRGGASSEDDDEEYYDDEDDEYYEDEDAEFYEEEEGNTTEGITDEEEGEGMTTTTDDNNIDTEEEEEEIDFETDEEIFQDPSEPNNQQQQAQEGNVPIVEQKNEKEKGEVADESSTIPKAKQDSSTASAKSTQAYLDGNENSEVAVSQPETAKKEEEDATTTPNEDGADEEKPAQAMEQQQQSTETPPGKSVEGEPSSSHVSSSGHTQRRANRKDAVVVAAQEAPNAGTTAAAQVVPPAPRSGNTRVRGNVAPQSGGGTSNNSNNAALKRAQQEIARLQKLHAAAVSRATAAEQEIVAQHAELENAAARLQSDRERHADELEDADEEHQEELDGQKVLYEQRLQQLADDYEARLAEATQQIKAVQSARQQEGGDLAMELQQVLDREHEALAQIDELTQKVETLETRRAELERQNETWQTQVATLEEGLRETTARERQVEGQMDTLKQSHQRQLTQRQERETALEQNVAQLSAALAQHKEQFDVTAAMELSRAHDEQAEYKGKWQEVSEELVTVKGQLDWANQRCEALQSELQAVSDDRLAEAAHAQTLQQNYDAQVARLQADLQRLESKHAAVVAMDRSKNSNGAMDAKLPKAGVMADESALQASKQQVQSLSDQLVRQSNLLESSKSEVLALKGRLQAALNRAETAEQEAQATAGHNGGNDLERGVWSSSGGAASSRPLNARRRKRGGRTMRTALGIRASGSPLTRQVVQTVDALDLWMLETGLVLKQEPLARLGLLAYAVILHMWCFGLVMFHTVESEHGDLGSLTSRRVVLGGHMQP